MTTEQLLQKFNPANAANLTAQDLETLRGLTDQQIDELAKAYPNQPTRRAYLRLYDTSKPENKQLFNLSTWQNLRNVRKFSNMKNLVPYDFIATPIGFQNQQRQAPRPIGSTTSNPRKVIVDLSAKEAADQLRSSVAKPTPPAKPTTVKNITSKPQPKPAAEVVEKKVTTMTTGKTEIETKPAPGTKKAAAPKAKKQAPAVVENPGGDGSEQFPSVE